MVQEVRHLVATEQVLESLPANTYLSERAESHDEAGQLADYLQARKSTTGALGDKLDKVGVKGIKERLQQ